MPKEVMKVTRVFDPEKLTTMVKEGFPWSHVVKATGPLIFVAGQAALGPDGHALHKGDIVKQTEAALESLKTILEEVGSGIKNVVATTWFVTSIEEFYGRGASEVRRRYFERDFPTSTLVEIKRLAHPDLMVEVEAVAVPK